MKSKEKINYMIEHLDKSLIKGKDLGLFNQVVDYLKDSDLEIRLEGEVKDNAYKGCPRTYHKIEIVAKSKHSIWSLLRTYSNKKPFELGEKISVLSKDTSIHRIVHSYEIKQKDPRTEILLYVDLKF